MCKQSRCSLQPSVKSNSSIVQAARPSLTPLPQALLRLLGQISAEVASEVESEVVSTLEADGRVLAEDVVSALHVPAWDNSSMDGYAVRCSDMLATGTELLVSQRIAAGSFPDPLRAGTAARIFTGAPVPPGADTVVMQEDCEQVSAGSIRINSSPVPGQYIRRAGEDISRGQTILSSGTRLGPAEQGLAASIGRGTLKVARQPRVALFSTGDELVMPGTVEPSDMPAGSIYNSNRFFLAALLRRFGCIVSDLGIVPDKREATLAALTEAARGNDLILTSGGVSVGEEDHIKPAVQSLGALDLWQISIKPGKPFAYGHINSAADKRTHFMGLPGNPVSSFLTFLLLVRPFILKLQGCVELEPRRTPWRADFSWPKADKRQEFLRVRRNAQGGLDLFPNQSSAVLTSAVWGDGVVDNPGGKTIVAGETVQFISFDQWLA